MRKRVILLTGLGIAAVLAIAGGAWILWLPPAPAVEAASPIAQDEVDATIAALKPPKRERPLIAVVGINDSTELTDFLMPYGILRRAEVADVRALSTQSGPMTLYPGAMKIVPQETIAEFDAQSPDGADYVIVPAMTPENDPAVLQWIKGQSDKGAIVVGVCAGAKVVANAGLLDGKQATTHWYYVEQMLDEHPRIQYVADRRIVVDGRVVTTTGITASMPLSLTLIEAIAGRDKAEAVARNLGAVNWDARHNSGAFKFTRPFALTAMGNRLPFWTHEQLGMEIPAGVDEVTLSMVADAWSRTFRSHAVTFAATGDAQQSRSGLGIIADQVASSWPPDRLIPAIGARKPVQALDDTLHAIADRYGRGTADFVAMQLEYPR